MEIATNKWAVTVFTELFLESDKWGPEQISKHLGIEPDRIILGNKKLQDMPEKCISPKNAFVLTQFRGKKNATFLETNSLFKEVAEEILNRLESVREKLNDLPPHISKHLVSAISAKSAQPQWCSLPIDLIKRLASMGISVMVTWKKMEEENRNAG